MELLQHFAYIIIGLLALIYGGDYTIRGAVAVAEKWGLSPAVVGIAIVGFGTSLPELLVALNAVSNGNAPVALGNVVGSNIANILLVLGVGACIAPQYCDRKIVVRDGIFMVLASVLLVAVLYDESISRSAGLAMAIALAIYLIMAYITDEDGADDAPDCDGDTLPLSLAFLIGGMVVLMVGADVFVNGAVATARIFDVPESVIGLSLVAIGTSLPELSATIMAARQNQTEIAIGNVLGSNVFNVLGVLGVTGAILPFDFAGQFNAQDGIIALILAVALVAMLFITKSLNRGTGIIMLGLYAYYMAVIF